jgi:CRP/FNR family transcriptional regulator, cyclic AMP receptor protein
MEDLDFTRPASSQLYDPAVTRMCFEALGTPESVAAGQTFFVENQASDRMYLLIEGDVSLLRGKKPLDVIRPGEIFGEMAVISRLPRSATATARTACRALSLDARQFEKAIQRTPEFALMLMSILINRLRLTVTMLSVTKSLPHWREAGGSRIFDQKVLDALIAGLSEHPLQHFPLNKVVMREGEGGVFMYVVIKGRIAISIKSTVVERVGPGGLFGEMALIDQSPRAASATAETDCTVLAVNRNDLLSLVKAKPEFGVFLLKAIADRLRNMTASQR